MTESCAVCGRPGVPGCLAAANGSTGTLIPVEVNGNIQMRECPNVKTLRLRKFLSEIDPQMVGPEIKHDTSSPLYQSGGDDLTKKNLWIKQITWGGFLTHLKWVAACKGLNWYCRVVSDRTLINIFVGNTSVKVRVHQSDEDDLITTNSIEDYLSGPDLVIIRLGLVIHTNKAAANVLSETLRMRKALGKPTWLVEPEDMSFTPYRTDFGSGMVMCSDENYNFVSTHYTKMNLAVKSGSHVELAPRASYLDSSDQTFADLDKMLEDPHEDISSDTHHDVVTKPVVVKRQVSAAPSVSADSDLVLDVSAFTDNKKKTRKKW